jgi:hypothetical protein
MDMNLNIARGGEVSNCLHSKISDTQKRVMGTYFNEGSKK